MFVVLWVAVSWFAFAAAPGVVGLLGFSPWLVAHGEVWRIFSWPLANQVNLWAVFNLFFFYIFGIETEAQIGRTRMAKLLLGIWATLTGASAAVMLLIHALNPAFQGNGLMGIAQVQFILFLVWIFENPNRPFFFNIPAWVIGAVLVGLQVLQLTASRDLPGLFELVIVAALVAMLARRLGMLSQYDWIPGRPSRKRPNRQQRSAQREADQRATDVRRLDELLEKIHAKGMDSLSSGERRELMKLRNRR